MSDLNSTNGTTVNNAPVQEWQLADGDVIRVGHQRSSSTFTEVGGDRGGVRGVTASHPRVRVSKYPVTLPNATQIPTRTTTDVPGLGTTTRRRGAVCRG